MTPTMKTTIAIAMVMAERSAALSTRQVPVMTNPKKLEKHVRLICLDDLTLHKIAKSLKKS